MNTGKVKPEKTRVFICYRRAESGYAAGRLADDLCRSFDHDQIFQDIASIEPGADYIEALRRALGSCAAVLVLICKEWLNLTDSEGRRRLELPDDWVSNEVAESLEVEDTRVFPVLLDDAVMPSGEQLPHRLKPLTRRQAVQLTMRHWANDVELIVSYLRKIPGLAATPGQEPKPRHAEPASKAAKRTPRVAGIDGSAAAIPTGARTLAERESAVEDWPPDGDVRTKKRPSGRRSPTQTPISRGRSTTVEYGARALRSDCEGADVAELQIRLAGFRGTAPTGYFGAGTERQVMCFQHDFMKQTHPSGVVDRLTMQAIDRFADLFPLDFKALECPCGQCGGFGQGRFKGRYLAGTPRSESYYRYEYPGMHRMLLWAVRAVFFYLPEYSFAITSGYRCGVYNAMRGRTSTAHHGKAIDLGLDFKPGVDKRKKMESCDIARARIVWTADAQIGWTDINCKALEPKEIAPTWIHYDVRCYDAIYLKDEFFCKTLTALDSRKPICF